MRGGQAGEGGDVGGVAGMIRRSASRRSPGHRPSAGWPSSSREGGLADRARADRLVPVAQGAARVPGVVGVDEPEPVRRRPWPRARPASPSCRPGVATSCPAAQAWQVSKQTPSQGWRSTASRYGSRSSTRAARQRPPPALGSTSRRGPPAAAASSSRGSSTSRTWRSAVGGMSVGHRGAGVENHAARADLRAAAQPVREGFGRTARPWPAVGEPRLTSSEA